MFSPSADAAADLGQDGVALRLAGLEEFLDAGKTLRDVLATGDTAGMEGTHGQLCAGLTDSLRGDDTDGFAHVDGAAGGQIGAVAAGAHAGFVAAGEDAAHLSLRDTGVARSVLASLVGDGCRLGRPDISPVSGCDDILGGHAAHQAVLQALDHLVADA